MIIGIDIRVLGKKRRTGVEDYTINLLSNLLPMDKSVQYRLFYNGFRKPDLNFSWLKLPNVKLKIWRFPNRIFDLFLRFLRFPKLDKILKGVDIFLSPHFLLTPVSKKTKIIVIFHDLSFIQFPEFFSLPKLLWHKFIYPKKQAQKADLIIAVSQSTKEDLIHFYKIEPEKIKFINEAVDRKFRAINKDDPKLLRVKKKYNLPDKFILYFGTIEPRKNIIGLIKAFECIKQTSDWGGRVQWQGFEGRVRSSKEKLFDFSSLRLVIAGAKGWLYDEVSETVRNSQFKKDIIFTGFIDEEDKLYLYNLAEVFVYPSFFEGFGLPPLEAMTCSVPVIVSNKSSLPEVVAKGAIMVDPHNIDEISFAIKEVLENKDLKEHLKKQGLKQIKQFSWSKIAQEFLKVFKEYEKNRY